MSKAVVYWIHHHSHTNPYEEGYVGVTVDFQRRLKDHLRESKKNIHRNQILSENITNEKIVVDLLLEGSEEECYDYERKLRPKTMIGWNIAVGGANHPCIRSGYSMPEEFRDKRRNYMLGNTIASGNKGKSKSEEHKRKISESNRGKIISEEQKTKQSMKMKGRKLSSEHKEKIRLAGLGKKRGPYKKKVTHHVDL